MPAGRWRRGGQVGILGERDFMDTPFNQSATTPSTLIQNQQARSIVDVAANDPRCATPGRPSATYCGADRSAASRFNSNDMSFGGLLRRGADDCQWRPTTWSGVEMLKGPSAMLNGMPPFGSVGGAINLVPKRGAGPAAELCDGELPSAGQVGGAVDFARRFGDDKKPRRPLQRPSIATAARRSTARPRQLGAARVRACDYPRRPLSRAARLRLPEPGHATRPCAPPMSAPACRCRWRPAAAATGSSPGPTSRTTTCLRRQRASSTTSTPDWTIYRRRSAAGRTADTTPSRASPR